jgi:large subunit ribosomal protein L5e
MGVHVQEYMEMLQEEDPERYKAQFAKFLENDIEPDGIEDMYTECHSKIREDPKFERDVRTVLVSHKRNGHTIVPSDGEKSYTRKVKLTLTQRRARVQQKMASARDRLLAAAEEE